MRQYYYESKRLKIRLKPFKQITFSNSTAENNRFGS